MKTFESARTHVAALLERAGRPDLNAWAIPCWDAEVDTVRPFVSLRNDPSDQGWLARQRRTSQRFLQLCTADGQPRWLFVLVWMERAKLPLRWGFICTAVQCAHPDIVYFRECCPYAPPPPSSHIPCWDTEILSLTSLQPPQHNKLPEAIVAKAKLVASMQRREVVSWEALDGGWLDLESSRVLVARRVLEPYWEARLMAERFMRPWRQVVLPLPAGEMSMLDEGVITLVGSRKIVPVRGRVAMTPYARVQIAAETFRLTLHVHSDDGHHERAVFLAVEQARRILVRGDENQPVDVVQSDE